MHISNIDNPSYVNRGRLERREECYHNWTDFARCQQVIIIFHVALKGQINLGVLFNGMFPLLWLDLCSFHSVFCRLHVNLQCGSDSDADIALHINPRYEKGSAHVMYNTYQNGTWGSEQSTPDSPIVKDKLFAIEILVTKEAYKVYTLCRS